MKIPTEMNKKTIQDLIPKAMLAIKQVGIVGTDEKFNKVHKGYINALGPNIVQSGLLPTLIFYNKDERKLWLKALYYMQEVISRETESADIEPTAIIKLITGGEEGRVKDLKSRTRDWEHKILEYAIALKLALRTFVVEEPKKDEMEQQEGSEL